MKSIYYLLLLLTICMPGCAMLASDSSLDKSKASSLTHLYVVPIEGIPLVPGSLYGQNCQDFIQSEMDSLLNKNEIWEPSNEVAKKTKHYLETVGNYSVTIAPDVEPLPGIESWEPNVSLWEIPFKNWYNENPSSIDYMDPPNSDTVLEVSTSYPTVRRNDNLQIVMKLVDTTTRSVLANASCDGFWPPSQFKELFLNLSGTNPRFLCENSLFANRRKFHKTVETVIPECIKSLGLQKK